MTGYGRGHGQAAGPRVTVEIRAVNHRFLDLKLRGANIEAACEEALRKKVSASLSRGSVSVSVRIDVGGQRGEGRIDERAAQRACEELRGLSRRLGLQGDIGLGLLLAQPGVVVHGELDEEATKSLSASILAAADEALQGLAEMRTTEGAELCRDLLSRVETLRGIAAQLREKTDEAPELARKRFEERIAQLLKASQVEVDPQRLAQEVAIAADKMDVTEELVRVASHLQQISDLADSHEPVGRRLDFLVQELGREFNTIGSKSQSAEIARLVVEAKAEMEKIREQVQNIE